MPPSNARVTLGDVAGSILDAKLPAGGPILARRRGPERKLEEEKKEEREQQAILRAKRALSEKPHKTLRASSSKATHDPVLETMLRKTATKGVVALFNAVRTAQKDEDPNQAAKRTKRKREAKDASKEAGKDDTLDLSKESFLDILRRGSADGAKRSVQAKVSEESGRQSNGARFLSDDYMLGKNRSRDYEREVEGDELEAEYAEDIRGAEMEEDDEYD